MSENQFNPKEERDCYSCAYIGHKQGTAHKGCKRNFSVGTSIPATLMNKKTGTSEPTACYIDLNAVKCAKLENGKKVACILKVNQWTRMFPLDFDPRWVVVCLGWSKEADERFVVERSPLEQMFGILGSEGRI